MKRVWVGILLCAVLLCGCRKTESVQPQRQQEEPVTEQAPISAEQPEEGGGELAGECAAAYRAITEDLMFLISVEGTDGSSSALDMTPDNAAMARGREAVFAETFRWDEAAEEDWLAQTEEQGHLLTLADSDSQTRIQCRTESDVICWRMGGGAVRYAEVTDVGAESHRFSKLLLDLAEDELERQAWSQTVSGTFAPAGKMAEAIAAWYRELPGWVSWKPLDMKVERVELYDTYEGMPRQLCCNMLFRVKADDPESVDMTPWQVGDGLRERDEDGYWLWSTTVRMERDDAGVWRVAEKDIGGVFVELPFDWDHATLEQLVEAFFLSGGETNRRRIPDRLLELPEEELARLPELLKVRSEMEVKLLCGALGNRVKEGNSPWTIETLQPVMGAFDIYLDA